MVREDFYELLGMCLGAKTMIDLGAGHCNYCIEATKLGYKCTAVDGRRDRVPRERSFDFIKSDVTKARIDHDIVLMSGIFYHLDLGQQLELLLNIRESKARYIILNTHYIQRDIKGNLIGEFTERLTGDVKSGWIDGQNFIEGSRESLKNRPLAALYNATSFWHTQESLVKFIETTTKMKCIHKCRPFTEDRRFFFFMRP